MQRYSRRQFLTIGTGWLASSLAPAAGWAVERLGAETRTVSLYHTHTGERLTVCYFHDHAYRAEAMQRINALLRDHRTGDIETIDPRLIDALFRLKRQFGTDDPFHIISGYRSAKTNAMLRKRGSGVARFSYHMLGRAIDIRLPGCKSQRLRQACLDLRLGGVGYYPRSDFIHMDTGTVRTWKG